PAGERRARNDTRRGGVRHALYVILRERQRPKDLARRGGDCHAAGKCTGLAMTRAPGGDCHARLGSAGLEVRRGEEGRAQDDRSLATDFKYSITRRSSSWRYS